MFPSRSFRLSLSTISSSTTILFLRIALITDLISSISLRLLYPIEFRMIRSKITIIIRIEISFREEISNKIKISKPKKKLKRRISLTKILENLKF